MSPSTPSDPLSVSLHLLELSCAMSNGSFTGSDLPARVHRILARLENSGIRWVLVGAGAVNYYSGKPRTSQDVDLLVEGPRLEEAVAIAKSVLGPRTGAFLLAACAVEKAPGMAFDPRGSTVTATLDKASWKTTEEISGTLSGHSDRKPGAFAGNVPVHAIVEPGIGPQERIHLELSGTVSPGARAYPIFASDWIPFEVTAPLEGFGAMLKRLGLW